MTQVRSISEYSAKSIKKFDAWNDAITPDPNTTIEGSSKYIPLGNIGFPSCRIDSNSPKMQAFLRECEDIRAENHSDITVISKIQLLVAQTLNLFPTDHHFIGRAYDNPTRATIDREFTLLQQHCTFFHGLEDKAAPLSRYMEANTADCRATNLLFATALKHVGFDVKWSYIQAQRAKVDALGNLSELEEPEDHALVLWNVPHQPSPIVLDAYFSEYHGYSFADLQNGIDRNVTKRYTEQNANGFVNAFTLYHGYEQDHGGHTGKPDRIHGDAKNFSGIWKVNDYPRSVLIERERPNPFID